MERSSCHLYLGNLRNAVDSRDGSLSDDGKEKGDGEVLHATSKGSGLLGCVLDGARHQMDEDVEVRWARSSPRHSAYVPRTAVSDRSR